LRQSGAECESREERGGSPFWLGFWSREVRIENAKGGLSGWPSRKPPRVKSRDELAMLRQGCPSQKALRVKSRARKMLAQRGKAWDEGNAVAKRRPDAALQKNNSGCAPLAADAAGRDPPLPRSEKCRSFATLRM